MEHTPAITQASSAQRRGILVVAWLAVAAIPVAAVFAAAAEPIAAGALVLPSVTRPMHVRAETTSFDSSARSVLFSGHVHVEIPACKLSSDTFRVNYGDDFRDVKTARADGSVRIDQGARWFTGRDALLDPPSRTIVLTGSPTVHEFGRETSARKITIHLDTDQNVIE
jgi:lipopolysaccharide export system protein LptA